MGVALHRLQAGGGAALNEPARNEIRVGSSTDGLGASDGWGADGVCSGAVGTMETQ